MAKSTTKEKKLTAIESLKLNSIKREQKLVDNCYSIAMAIASDKKLFGKMSNEQVAAWVTRQLKLTGFIVEPSGASWGVLKR